jgi:peptidoglycan/xylan/chitin deacetylase (PgdA/CDA1 family)
VAIRYRPGLVLAIGMLLVLTRRGDASGAGAVSSGCQFHDGGIIRGPNSERRVALAFTGHTFAEDGPTILDQLAKHHAQASFFLTGDFLANTNFTSVIGRIVREGHYLGPHSDKHLLYCAWDTPSKTLITRQEFEGDLANNLGKITALGIRRENIRYFLPAYEHYNEEIAAWARAMNLALVSFTPGTRSNADYTEEADKNFVSSKMIFDTIANKEQTDPVGLNGFILLLHIGAGPGRHDKFAERFGDLLDFLDAHQYKLVRIDTLLEQRPRQTSPRN